LIDEVKIESTLPTKTTDTISEQAELEIEDKANTVAAKGEEEESTKKQAANLIETQRKSVNMLSHVKERVESLPYDDIINALTNNENRGFFIHDHFLGEDIAAEMSAEGISMYDNGKLELVGQIGSGEFGSILKGGDSYVDSPRCVEYVVSLTRHMPPLLKDAIYSSGGGELDNTASMGTLKTFSRKSFLASLELLTGSSDDEHVELSVGELECVTEGKEDDGRKLTVLYYLTPSGWDIECGGGLRFQNSAENTEEDELVVDAKRDRLVIFWSDRSLHRREMWKGKDGLDYAGCLETHLIKKQR